MGVHERIVGEGFGQRERLTVRLRGLLRSYPRSIGIVKELLQNADDAGATRLLMIWDGREHPRDALPDPRMSRLQGPALLFANDQVFTEADFQALIRAADRVSRAKLYVDDTAAPTILEIRARARRFRDDANIFDRDGQIGMIMVDYLQLARGGRGRYDSREQEISEISRGLKAMAKELNMPVIALSQLNRAVDSRADHRPMLSDLRESGAIEQDADVIMFIYRAERYLSAEASEAERAAVENKAEVIIGKQRNGPTGTVYLQFIKHHTRFENPAPV